MHTPPHFSVTDTRWIRNNARTLCEVALFHMGCGNTMQVWVDHFGSVLVGDDGQYWVGDLCYMREKFGWTHAEYMNAYGNTRYPAPGWDTQGSATAHLQINTFRDKHILVISTGRDGDGPLGLGLDTGAVSFVSTDRARIEAAAAACIAWLEDHRPQFTETLRRPFKLTHIDWTP